MVFLQWVFWLAPGTGFAIITHSHDIYVSWVSCIMQGAVMAVFELLTPAGMSVILDMRMPFEEDEEVWFDTMTVAHYDDSGTLRITQSVSITIISWYDMIAAVRIQFMTESVRACVHATLIIDPVAWRQRRLKKRFVREGKEGSGGIRWVVVWDDAIDGRKGTAIRV